uniref:Glycolate oxidase iron-sulfur subunit n=1 Tax=Desulfobacca acetoxidans TaxID=60893 RepID=A0A7V4G9E2_9BACT
MNNASPGEERLPPPAPAGGAACVRCGACMAVCPLYRLTGREVAVARGKLNLWRLVQEGTLTSGTAVRDLLEFCLLCGACTEKCAVGLAVPELIKEARAGAADGTPALRPSWLLPRLAWQAPHLIPAAAPFAPLLNRLKTWLGRESSLAYRLWPTLASALAHFPNLSRVPFRRQVPTLLPGRGRGRIALFTGCGLEALFPRAGLAFLSLCEKMGIEVVIPPEQGCCGLVAESAGEMELSRTQARALVHTFAGLKVDAVVTACASCSYRLKRLGRVLAGEPEEARARRLAGRVREAGEFLAGLAGFHPQTRAGALPAAYHDPCHLRRGQGIWEEHRHLLTLALGEPPREAATVECCGLGGVFGVTHPRLSRELGEARLRAYRAAGAARVVTSCSGCLVQLIRVADDLPVAHWLEMVYI